MAEEGRFRLPSSLRQLEMVVALQHSCWHAVVEVAVHPGCPGQVSAQPATQVVPVVFFNYKDRRLKDLDCCLLYLITFYRTLVGVRCKKKEKCFTNKQI